MDPILGQLMLVCFNFAPRGWMFCDGTLLPISQYSALFSLLGTTYGGDGVRTFALPDLRGRVPLAAALSGGSTPLTRHTMGETGGSEAVTLLTTQMPAHNHLVNTNDGGENKSTSSGNYLGGGGRTQIYNDAAGTTTLAANAVSTSGGNQPHDNMQPYIAMNWIIAIEGIYPSRQ